MKKTYRYDKNLGRMVEVKNDGTVERKGPYIMGDIQPYQAVGPDAGTWITSRSKHRQYLKDNNLIEVGNERKYFDGKPH